MCKPLYTCSSYRSSVRAATSACSWASWSVKCCCSRFARRAADSACCSRHVVTALSSATCTSHPYLHQALKESWQAYEHSSFKAAHPERPTQYHIGPSCLQDQARLHETFFGFKRWAKLVCCVPHHMCCIVDTSSTPSAVQSQVDDYRMISLVGEQECMMYMQQVNRYGLAAWNVCQCCFPRY